MLTEDLVATILARPKYIEDELQWAAKNRDMLFAEMRAPIRSDLNCNLVFVANCNLTFPYLFSFSIVYNGTVRVVGLDIGKEHQAQCRVHGRLQVGPKHKHIWKSCCRVRWAYEPADITTNASMEQNFWEFLSECNITYKGRFPALPVLQKRLWEP